MITKNPVRTPFLWVLALIFPLLGMSQTRPTFEYNISIPDPDTHQYHVSLEVSGWPKDTLVLQMSRWMPGYYQMMDYFKDLQHLKVVSGQPMEDLDISSWRFTDAQKPLKLEYDVLTHRQFVAISYVDGEHAYLIPENTFFYPEGLPKANIKVHLRKPKGWSDVATGLDLLEENNDEAVFGTDDFDILFDSPLLMGQLTKLTDFAVGGKPHRFWGYKMGSFDQKQLMGDLQKMIQESTDLIGDIPYNQYTFMGIGPGRGGIEHLNSTTVSFEGKGLQDRDTYLRMMDFLAHEYFHHYNVKRIRPFELGPFDYQNGSKTTQLWISEGLTSYFANLMVRRAGICTEEEFFNAISKGITAHENNPGKAYQSLIESSFETWQDGPNGKSGSNPERSISYYVKGPIVGMLFDFGIRHATGNQRSLDDVMRYLYREYYQKQQRGFTDAEFRAACEAVAGTSLQTLFEYVYTATPMDYDTYLGYAGLELQKTKDDEGKDRYVLVRAPQPTAEQKAILTAWLGN